MLAFRCFTKDNRTIEVLSGDRLVVYSGAGEIRSLAFAVVNDLSGYCLEHSNGVVELRLYHWAYLVVMALGAERDPSPESQAKLYSSIAELKLPSIVMGIGSGEAN
mgnify:CR=1 FL=1